MSYDPRRVVHLGDDEEELQRAWPAVAADGQLRLQPGDGQPTAYPVVGLGVCHGPIGNARWNTDVSASLVVTDCRAVVVATKWAKGAKYSAVGFHGPIISSTIKTKMAQSKANRDAAGQALVAQMRYPWISRIAYSTRQGRKGDNVVRLCGTHTTAFGEGELLMLLVQVDKTTDPRPIAQAIARKVVADRVAWETTSHEERAKLASAAFDDPSAVPVGSLPAIALAGSWRAPGSNWLGTHSSRSLPVPTDARDISGGGPGQGQGDAHVSAAADQTTGRIVDRSRPVHCARIEAGSPPERAAERIPLDWSPAPVPPPPAMPILAAGAAAPECAGEFPSVAASYPAEYNQARSILAGLTARPRQPELWLAELCQRIHNGSPPEVAAERIPLDWGLGGVVTPQRGGTGLDSTATCGSCGAPNRSSARFCGGCGQPPNAR
ncbi:MAG TPA: zinc ribbon domain-containing protein [Acidimicrobiia bacterium]|jgi:hypothetical protein